MSYVESLFGLNDKRVIITGGAGVIAGAMTEALLRAGAHVCLWDRSASTVPVADAAKKAAEAVQAHGRVHGLIADVGHEDDVRRAVAETEALMGPPNVLINAAGGNKGKSSFVETDLAVFREVIEMNLMAGLMIPTKILAAYWIGKKIRASVINMTSMASYVPLSGVWAYDAAKSAVLNLTMATAKEFAPHGIRVNAIAPGFFIGHQNRALLIKDEASGELTERGRDVIAHTPFGRFGNHDELVGVTIFLASDAASGFVTGVSVPVDGGYLVHNI